MKFSVYVIENPDGKIYIGQTNDLIKRLKRHNGELLTRQASYTKRHRGPWSLIYEEQLIARQEAIKREKELKSSRGRSFLKQFRKKK